MLCYVTIIILANKLDSFTIKQPKHSFAVIVGTARDIEPFLARTFIVIDMIRSCFANSAVIIYENDSKDRTLELLNAKAAQSYDFRVISEKDVKGLRTHRLAHGRNICIDEALKYDSDYVIVMDLDDVNSGLTKDAFLSSFKNSLDVEWSVITANQRSKYYDLWALRTHDDWMPFDCWVCASKRGINYCVNERYRSIPEDNKPILVKSAFGGLAIYKTSAIGNARYYGGDGNRETCEHVSFHENIRDSRIFINPKMINH